MSLNLLKFSKNLINFNSNYECVKSRLVNMNIRFQHRTPVGLHLKQKSRREQVDYASFDNCHVNHETGNSLFWQRKMRTVHNLLDVNKDGIISYDDFKLLADRFVQLGHLPEKQQHEFYDIIEKMWKEQWGCIDPYNLITTQQYLEDMKHVINDEDRRKKVHTLFPYLFKAVDNNGDGSISFSEYQLFFKCLGLSYKDAIASFESIDTDKDGKLTMEEFIKLGREFFITDDESKPSKLFWGPLLP
ncbi:sarcoplasmic calcium-binding protein isoform X2 [Planococcus citri]|uniref:sarcoplasmic calcium-binding protein isoform X2 n=1 Tax=Planococcus citri TaxID=170843 RepID=UPI0031F929A9